MYKLSPTIHSFRPFHAAKVGGRNISSNMDEMDINHPHWRTLLPTESLISDKFQKI